jgi:hypothetical protein
MIYQKFRVLFSFVSYFGLVLAISSPKSAQAVSFSVDMNAVGLQGSGVNQDHNNPQQIPQQQNNIYYGYDGTNVRDVQGGPGGIGLPQGVDLNSLSKGKDPTRNIWDLLFSVDINSQGRFGTDVRREADGIEAAGDIFFFNPMTSPGTNNLRDWGEETQHGLKKGSLGVQEDELNAFDVYEGAEEPLSARYQPLPQNIYFSINGTLDANRGSEDILLANGAGGPITLFKDGIMDIGLKNGDDIDALALDLANNQAFFSLAPNSPTLQLAALGLPIFGNSFSVDIPARNWSAADIFSTNFGGSFDIAVLGGVKLYAENIGLSPTDNVDALDTAMNDPVKPTTVPEPTSTLSLLILGTLGAASTLKRKLKPCQFIEKETTKVG